jgi:hypothetical protein
MTVYRAIKNGEIQGTIQVGEKIYRIPVSGVLAYLTDRLVDGRQLGLDVGAMGGE